ncbi:MAG: PilZ domain-containing protein [Deltaproteobacteria bacterium]|nr:PilZ domain-containing protein [Deltaproteobacteria bacterium]
MLEPLTIVTISDNAELGEICRSGFRRDSMLTVHQVASISDFRAWAPGNAICAILIDMKTLMRSGSEERKLIHDLSESMPVVRMRFDASSREVAGTIEADALAGDQLFGYVSERVRTQRRAREIRRFPRRKTILNVSIQHEAFGPEPFRTTTGDASEGGMFIITSTALPAGAILKLFVRELSSDGKSDPAPITARVQWCIEWGKSTTHHPGLGLQFLEIPEEQRMKLVDRVGLRSADLSLDSMLADMGVTPKV